MVRVLPNFGNTDPTNPCRMYVYNIWEKLKRRFNSFERDCVFEMSQNTEKIRYILQYLFDHEGRWFIGL